MIHSSAHTWSKPEIHTHTAKIINLTCNSINDKIWISLIQSKHAFILRLDCSRNIYNKIKPKPELHVEFINGSLKLWTVGLWSLFLTCSQSSVIEIEACKQWRTRVCEMRNRRDQYYSVQSYQRQQLDSRHGRHALHASRSFYCGDTRGAFRAFTELLSASHTCLNPVKKSRLLTDKICSTAGWQRGWFKTKRQQVWTIKHTSKHFWVCVCVCVCVRERESVGVHVRVLV